MRLTAFLAVLIVLITGCSGYALADQQDIRPGSYVLGANIQDFSFTTYSGQEYTLSGILAEKDMVLINIWASWCGPCRMEFPYLQEAYSQYQDKVEVIALSCETTDTPADLRQFASNYGLTFKIGQDPVNFLSALGINGIPVSLVVDRFGKICFIETGAQPSAEAFMRLFDAYIGDTYTESLLLTEIPAERPRIIASNSADISAALGIPACAVDTANCWPMVTSIVDNRHVVESTNASYQSTQSAIEATVEANAGDAIVVTFKTSTEDIFDTLSISINGVVVKRFGGEHDWMTYAVPVEKSGTQVVTVAYQKDQMSDGGEDKVWVDSIMVTSDANAWLMNNPTYPTAAENMLHVVTPGSREIRIDDPNGILMQSFGNAKYYVINSDVVELYATLTKDVDPETAFLYSYFDGVIKSMSQIEGLDGYRMITGVDSIGTTGYSCSYVVMYRDAAGSEPMVLVNFRDEDNLNSFVNQNGLGTWTYIEKTNSPVNTTNQSMTQEQAIYTINCLDQYDNPVAGVMIQICDDDTCQVIVTDSNGSYVMSAEPYPWEVHILKAPDGYTADTSQVIIMPVEGDEVTFALTKE